MVKLVTVLETQACKACKGSGMTSMKKKCQSCKGTGVVEVEVMR